MLKIPLIKTGEGNLLEQLWNRLGAESAFAVDGLVREAIEANHGRTADGHFLYNLGTSWEGAAAEHWLSAFDDAFCAQLAAETGWVIRPPGRPLVVDQPILAGYGAVLRRAPGEPLDGPAVVRGHSGPVSIAGLEPERRVAATWSRLTGLCGCGICAWDAPHGPGKATAAMLAKARRAWDQLQKGTPLEAAVVGPDGDAALRVLGDWLEERGVGLPPEALLAMVRSRATPPVADTALESFYLLELSSERGGAHKQQMLVTNSLDEVREVLERDLGNPISAYLALHFGEGIVLWIYNAMQPARKLGLHRFFRFRIEGYPEIGFDKDGEPTGLSREELDEDMEEHGPLYTGMFGGTLAYTVTVDWERAGIPELVPPVLYTGESVWLPGDEEIRLAYGLTDLRP
jgi:hypothetical protein